MMKHVSELEDISQGETVYVVASGPSVNDSELELILDKPVLLINGAVKLLDQYRFQNATFVTTDKRFLLSEENRKYGNINKLKNMKRILRHDLHPYDEIGFKDKTWYIKSLGRDGFSHDLDIGFYFGSTSVMLAIQSAWYMGASKVVLVGVDFTYILGERRFYKESIPEPVDAAFGVQVWNISNAYREFKEDGRSLVVSSEGSLLRPYIPYENLSDAVELSMIKLKAG